MSILLPINDCALVELAEETIATPDRQYDTKTSGIVASVHTRIEHAVNRDSFPQYDYLKGKRVFFDDFKDGTKVIKNDKTYTFIKLTDIKGYEDV